MLQLQPGESLALQVDWFERYQGIDLPLATLRQQFNILEDGQMIRLNAADYRIDDLDSDGDGRINLLERLGTTDPLMFDEAFQVSGNIPRYVPLDGNDAPDNDLGVAMAADGDTMAV